MRLSPELESYLKTLKSKYSIGDVDFARLLFLLDEWAVELRMENVEGGLQLASRLVEALKAR
jgi:hypothetical protein